MNKFNWKANISTVSDKFKLYSAKKTNPCNYCRNWQEIIKHNILWKMLKFHSNSSHLDYLLSIERRYMGIWVWSTDFPFPGRVGVLYKYLFNCKTYASLYFYIPQKQRITFSTISIEISFSTCQCLSIFFKFG